MTDSPPVGAKVAVTKPLAFEVHVVKPSGAPIADARVEMEWDFNDNVTVLTTGATGKVDVPVLEPKLWVLDTKVIGTLRVSKPHHGPVVDPSQPFKNEAARLPIQYKPDSETPIKVITLEETQEVRWGRPRVLGAKRNILEVTLVEGGMLGAQQAETPTRKLNSQAQGNIASEVNRALLFHVACGELALTTSTDFVFEHDESATDCVAGACRIVSVGARSGNDPTLTADETAELPYVDKLAVRNAVFGGLRAGNVVALLKDTYTYGPTQTTDLNPRNVVGIVRLARKLVAERGVRVLLTVGFLRFYKQSDLDEFNAAGTAVAGLQAPEPGRLKRDAHGRGRGIDFSGATLEHPQNLRAPQGVQMDPTDPNVSLSSGNKREYEPQKDFLVFKQWGKLEMLFEDASGNRKRGNSSSDFHDNFRPDNKKKIFYRLDGINDPVDPSDPNSTAPKREAGQELTPEHYTDTHDLFLDVYQFFCEEYSHENQTLGPSAKDASTNIPGEVSGSVIHPDYPSKSSRNAHQDHIHANLGDNGPSQARGPAPNRKRLGIWASRTEVLSAKGSGYEL